MSIETIRHAGPAAAAGFELIPEQPDAPLLRTEIPGPKARALADRDRRVMTPSYTRPYTLVVDRAIGSVVTDVDGNRFLDLTAGIAVTSTGHCHPHVVEAVERQAKRCLHMSGTDFYYEPEIELAERLAASAPMAGPNRVCFGNSGAEAVEAAFKLARYHTGRTHVIAFHGAFHGRTCGALSLTASKVVQRRGFGPLVPGVSHVSYPNPYHPTDLADVVDHTMGELDDLFRHEVAADEVAAIFVEPVLGEGGYVVPPADFLPRLRQLCDRHGILLVCDEVQCGMGRTGKLWAVQHDRVAPDVIATAKGIASGLPLGAIIAPASIMDWPSGSHASTFGGNPVSCAAALATLDLLEAGLIENAAEVGGYLLDRLRDVQRDCAAVGDVRGRGLMVGIEIVQDRESRRPDPALRDRLVQESYRRGLLLLGAGESVIRLSPALTLTRGQIDVAVSIFRDALQAAMNDLSGDPVNRGNP